MDDIGATPPLDSEPQHSLKQELTLGGALNSSVQELFETSHSNLGREVQICDELRLQTANRRELELLLGSLRRAVDKERTRLEIWAAEIKAELSELGNDDGSGAVSNNVQPLLHGIFLKSQRISSLLGDVVSDDSNETPNTQPAEIVISALIVTTGEIHSLISELFHLVEVVNKALEIKQLNQRDQNQRDQDQRDQDQRDPSQQDPNQRDPKPWNMSRQNIIPSILATPGYKLPKRGLIRSTRKKDPNQPERIQHAQDLVRRNSEEVRAFQMKLEAEAKKGRVPHYSTRLDDREVEEGLDELRISKAGSQEVPSTYTSKGKGPVRWSDIPPEIDFTRISRQTTLPESKLDFSRIPRNVTLPEGKLDFPRIPTQATSLETKLDFPQIPTQATSLETKLDFPRIPRQTTSLEEEDRRFVELDEIGDRSRAY